MEARYSRAQKEEASEAFRKQLENGDLLPGEMQALSRKLNISVTTLYGWKVELKKKLVGQGELANASSNLSSSDKFQVVSDVGTMSELEIGEYLRKRGISKEELVSWEKTVETSFDRTKKHDTELAK